MSGNIHYIVIYPESHQHLGLLKDLEGRSDVQLIVTAQKKLRSKPLALLRKAHLSWSINRHVSLPLKSIWYEPIHLELNPNRRYCIVVFDIALRTLAPDMLNRLFARENVRGVLVLINAMESQSPSFVEVQPKIGKVRWSDIYTFDSGDAQKYGFKPLGCCYYSQNDAQEVLREYADDPMASPSDAYFMGGIKGGRESDLMAVFRRLKEKGATLNFNFTVRLENKPKQNPYPDEIRYITGGWIPYRQVLAGTLQSNVIIEVLQKGQSGPSLRYYEAVCHNKKLLTNNLHIVDLPYYDSRYMKVFASADDIDADWVMRREEIDYGYQGEFSPVHLLDTVLNG